VARPLCAPRHIHLQYGLFLLIVGGLSYFPALAMGPIVEQLLLGG
jgi:K+-transporting ATPase A subunit